jgi:hypothetical protein
MAQVLRITFNDIDYNYQVINTTPIGKDTFEIQILLDGNTHTLTRQQGQWLAAATENADPNLLAAIGRALSLRYHI